MPFRQILCRRFERLHYLPGGHILSLRFEHLLYLHGGHIRICERLPFLPGGHIFWHGRGSMYKLGAGQILWQCKVSVFSLSGELGSDMQSMYC